MTLLAERVHCVDSSKRRGWTGQELRPPPQVHLTRRPYSKSVKSTRSSGTDGAPGILVSSPERSQATLSCPSCFSQRPWRQGKDTGLWLLSPQGPLVWHCISAWLARVWWPWLHSLNSEHWTSREFPRQLLCNGPCWPEMSLWCWCPEMRRASPTWRGSWENWGAEDRDVERWLVVQEEDCKWAWTYSLIQQVFIEGLLHTQPCFRHQQDACC